MPQRGAAQEPQSLNAGTRRRELERITHENQGIVQRIQGRKSSFYPANQWSKRSEEHDRQLLLMRRPATSYSKMLPTPPSPRADLSSTASSAGRSRRTPRAAHVAIRRARAEGMSVTQLLAAAKPNDAHILVGLASGLQPGSTLRVRPATEDEERVVVHETWLRNDGLVVLLRDALKEAHPLGATVMLEALKS